MSIDTVLLGTGIFAHSPGQMIEQTTTVPGYPRTEKYIKNMGTLRTTIQPGYDGNPRLTVEVSAPKLLYGDSLHEVTDKDLFPFVERVTGALEGFGVRADVESMQVGRVDVCRNLHLSHDVASFIDGCTQFTVGRTERHTYGVETVRWGNKQWSTQYYDKEAETVEWKLREARKARDRAAVIALKAEQKDLAARPHYILRAESSARKPKKVSTLFRVASPILSDVWNEERGREILVAHFDTMRNGGKGKTIPPRFDDLVEWLTMMRESGKRNALLEAMAMKGAVGIMHDAGGSEDGLRRALLSAGYERSSAYRQIQKARRFVIHGMKVNTFDLLAEVRQKLAA